jgi:hypothetical protein
MSKQSRIAVMLIACLGAVPAAVASTVMGSSLVSRQYVDGASGQVYIYAGGSFQSGLTLSSFSLFADNFTGQRDVTPILFELTSPGVYTVRGVGTGDMVSPSAIAQSFAFGLQYGTATTTNGNYTFGFINAFVNTLGQQTSSTAGVVDFNTPVVAGSGVGGAGTTNDWVFTPTVSNINIALGATFGLPGQVASYTLNNPSRSFFDTDRTYSATLDAPEPGSFTLACIGVILIGGALIRRRVHRSA